MDSCSKILLLLHLVTSACDIASGQQTNVLISGLTKLEQISRISRSDFAGQITSLVANNDINLMRSCRESLSAFATELLTHGLRESALFDSFSKIKPGSLSSNDGYNLGDYDLCLRHGRYAYLGIHLPSGGGLSQNQPNSSDWRLQWMHDHLPAKRLDPYHFGICVPDQCRESDLMSIFSSAAVKQVIHPLTVSVFSTESLSDEPVKWTMTQNIAAIILSSILVIGLTSTMVNHLLPHVTLPSLIQAFDIAANMRELFSESRHPNSMYTNANIYRVIYVFNSIMAHIALNVTFTGNISRLEASAAFMDQAGRYSALSILAAAIPVSLVVNFIPSSCFAALKWIPLMRKRSVSFAEFVYERVIRTLPVMMTMLLIFHVLPVVVIHKGPMMKHTLASIADVCYKNGWKELLFVNNFADMRNICMPVAWFISAEFQLYCVSFITFYLIAKYPHQVNKVLMCHLVIALIASGCLFLVTGIPPVLSFRSADLHELVTLFPAKNYHTINYAAVYPIGIFLGMQMLQQEGKAKGGSYFWMAALVIGYAGSSISHSMLYSGDKYDTFAFSPVVELMYAVLARPVFVLVIVAFFYNLMNSQNASLISLANSRFFVVISRISLCWFMSHAVCIILLFASYESTEVSVTRMLMEYLLILVISLPFACMLHVFVEVPFGKILSLSRSSSNSRHPATTVSGSLSKKTT